jgi:hypothetical protein
MVTDRREKHNHKIQLLLIEAWLQLQNWDLRIKVRERGRHWPISVSACSTASDDILDKSIGVYNIFILDANLGGTS